MIKIVGIVSAIVWIGAVAAFFLVKDKNPSEIAEGLGHGGAKDTSGQNSHGNQGHHGAESHDETASHSAHDSEGSPAKPNHEGHSNAALHTESGNDGHGAHTGDAADQFDEEDPEADGSIRPSREELSALRQLAEMHASQGNLVKAVAPMRRVMLMPTREAPLLSLAVDIFLGTGHYKEALKVAEQVLALKADDMKVQVQAVEAQYRLGMVEKAITAAQAALKLHPGDLAMLTSLGTMEVEMGQGHHDYGKSLQAALKLKPDYAPALYLQGRKAQLEGNYKDAETAFLKVVKLEPRNAKAFGQLGMALYHLGKEKEAEKAYRTELEMNPDDYNTWFNLGELQLSHAAQLKTPEEIQSLRAEAMDCYLKTLELNRDHAQAHYRMGVLLNGNGQYKEAIRHLDAALKTDSRHVPTLVQLSLAYEYLKLPERARSYLTKAYELDPLNKLVLFKLKPWS
ncbi:MAG: tetratricopeptide repeat protein [Fibrobacterota bacterium]|nr:tetratricopeptide repeat protein [Fibrobacterota bacterium]